MYLICAFVIVITDLFASSFFTQINAACLLIETELAAIVICLHPVNHKSLTISLLEPDHDVARASRTAVPWPVSVSVYMILCF